MKLRTLSSGLAILAVGIASAQEPSITLGWSTWLLAGDSRSFRAYATAPRGLFLRELRYEPRGPDTDFLLDVEAPFQDDYLVDGSVRLNHGATRLDVRDGRNRFFAPVPQGDTPNERHVMRIDFQQKLAREVALSFSTRMDQQDYPNTAPPGELHQRTRIWTASVRGRAWEDGFFDLSYTDWRTWDRTEVSPDVDSQTWSAGVMHQFGDALSVSGSYARTLIHIPERGEGNRIDAWSLGGNLALGDDTLLLAQAKIENLSLPTVANAYDRSRQLVQARLVHRFGGGWSGQVGYSRRALERVNADHTFVDVPKWHTFDAQVSGRLSSSLRLRFKASSARMQDGADMETDDPRALFWRERRGAEAKLEASSERASGYVAASVHEDRNDARRVRVASRNLAFGGTYQAQANLELYVDGALERWTGRIAEPGALDLTAGFPGGATVSFGANWTANPRLFLTANATLFRASNDNPLGLPGASVAGALVTATLRYQAPGGMEFGLTLAPWQIRDRVAAGRDYRLGLIQATASGRF